jgi:hypothetical protein
MTSQLLKDSSLSLPQPQFAAREKSIGLTALHVGTLCMIIGLAIAVRVVLLNSVGYNSDEAVYAGQGAAIAQVPVLKDLFPVFRAHPLLVQFTLALFYKFGMNDLTGRLVSVAIGVATVGLVYILGKRLYGLRVSLYAALFLALMPYHVIPTRQVLLDGPMVFCSTLALYALARYGESKRPIWLYSVGAAMGLTFLAKETGILLVGAIYAFLALSPEIRVRIRDIILSLIIMITIMMPYPLSVTLAGGGGGGKTQQYLVWQLFRRPNHTWDFYPTVVPPAIGWLVIIAAVLGLWLLRRQSDWREKLLVLWILVPAAFFQLWPTKGFQYLLPTAPAFALLAARTLAYWPGSGVKWHRWHIPQFVPGLLGMLLVAASLILPTWNGINRGAAETSLAGTGGVPGGREMGYWIREHVPEGATFMTVGPSMANIIRFYGHREAYGLSVSPNPLHRNPSYQALENPDFRIRTSELQYLVWDSFSASRSTFFSEKLLAYVEKYHGRVVHNQTVSITTPEGEVAEKAVIVIYEVHP